MRRAGSEKRFASISVITVHAGLGIRSLITTNPGLTLNKTYGVNPGLDLIGFEQTGPD